MSRFQKKKRLYIGIAVFILMGRLHLQKQRRKRRWCVQPWAHKPRGRHKVLQII